jgi:hypothetical protein
LKNRDLQAILRVVAAVLLTLSALVNVGACVCTCRYPGQVPSPSTPALVKDWVDHPNEQDAAIKVKALSRWNNYYVEGIRQMIDDFGFDGLYVRLY